MSVTTLNGSRADPVTGLNPTLQVQTTEILPPSASNCLETILPEPELPSSQNNLRPEISPPTSGPSAQCCTTSSGMASLISLSNSYIPDMDTLSKTSKRFQGLLDRQCGGVGGSGGPVSGIGRRRGRIFGNAARERTRVKTLRSAFLDLQRTLPSVPPDTKLSKLDVLVLATTYIGHLMKTLEEGPGNVQPFEPSIAGIGQSLRQSWDQTNSVASVAAKDYLHPVKKWPMRTRLYAGIAASAHNGSTPSSSSSPRDGHQESSGSARFDMTHIQ